MSENNNNISPNTPLTSSNNNINKNIILISLDGEKIEIDLKSIQRSQLIKGLLEDNPNEIEIPLSYAKGSILRKVIEYLVHYQDTEPKEIEKPLKSNNFKDCVDEWDFEYINVDTNLIFEIIKVANFMDIKSLLELSSAKIASIIKNDPN